MGRIVPLCPPLTAYNCLDIQVCGLLTFNVGFRCTTCLPACDVYVNSDGSIYKDANVMLCLGVISVRRTSQVVDQLRNKLSRFVYDRHNVLAAVNFDYS